MSVPRFTIDPDVRRARLPPGALYGDPAWFEAVQQAVVGRSWHLLHDLSARGPDDTVVPVCPGGHPLVWIAAPDGEGSEGLRSNVCTHRGATVVDQPCRVRTLRCPYHGRRWSLDGRMTAAPGFEGAHDFPTSADDLAAASLERLGPWRFGAVDPATSFGSWIRPVVDRIPWFDWGALRHDPAGDVAWPLAAHWALYVDNYLEGFHVPYVHPGLAEVLDPRDYRHELLPFGTLQIGVATHADDAFPLAADHPDHGAAGFYFWLFPTTMINVYPWGVSLNLVEPVGPTDTRVVYQRWLLEGHDAPGGAGGALDAVEQEDQAIVRRAQSGVRAKLYPGGRYAPDHEAGLHHFHRLLAAALG